MSVTFRPVRADDHPFLRALYASTRQDEMALSGWAPEQVEAFLTMQFELQHAHYQRHYADADFLVVEREGVPVGRLYVARWEREIRIVDIALVPEARGRGLGSRLMRELMAEAAEAGLPLRIHVEKFNPALRLYRRLGFTAIQDKGVYLFMEWRPDAAAPPED